jgi:4-hydroxybenzoate polyprenyltransferase
LTSAAVAAQERARPRATVARAAWSGLRPRQWTKNLLLFAGLVFAGKLADPDRWLEALAAFAAYCSLSSAAYLVNDIRDVEDDRAHPTKRRRPIASGALPVRAAIPLVALLLASGLAVAVTLGAASLAVAGSFLLLQLAYSTRLKQLPLVDVTAIAGLFVIRAFAGALAVHVHTSKWLLACTALLALFIAFSKRRSELALVQRGLTPGRRALGPYTPRALDRLVVSSAIAAVGAYAVYAGISRGSPAMLVTVPPVVAGVLRYLHLVRRHELGEEPETVLLRDRPTLVCVAVWIVSVAAVLGFR